MKKFALVLVGLMLLPTLIGCANCRNWFRGDSCDTCNPPSAQPAMYSSCPTGTCGSGIQQNMNGGAMVQAPGNQIYTDPYNTLVPQNGIAPGPGQ